MDLETIRLLHEDVVSRIVSVLLFRAQSFNAS